MKGRTLFLPRLAVADSVSSGQPCRTGRAGSHCPARSVTSRILHSDWLTTITHVLQKSCYGRLTLWKHIGYTKSKSKYYAITEKDMI